MQAIVLIGGDVFFLFLLFLALLGLAYALAGLRHREQYRPPAVEPAAPDRATRDFHQLEALALKFSHRRKQ